MNRFRNALHRKFRPCLEALEDRTVPSSIQGTVFHDLNGNGTYDSGETGVSGWTVFLDVNRNAVVDAGETAVTTDANGNYLIDNTSDAEDQYDFVGLVLEVGSGGRWLNTSATFAVVNRVAEEDAVRDFGVFFQPQVGPAPVGGETLVNDQTLIHDRNSPRPRHDAAADAQGNFLVAWFVQGAAGGPHSIRAQLFNADGTPNGGEILVALGVSSSPVVARADNGMFAVAWNVINSSTGTSVVYTRAYAANGTPLAGAVQVTPINKTIRNFVTDIAMDADGDFTVLYTGGRSSLGGTFWSRGTIGFQRYNELGQAVGKNTVVVDAPGSQGTQMAMDDAGNFVVVWDQTNSDGFSGVLAQRYTSAGKKTGAQIVVANDTHYVLVAMNSTGSFVVTWRGGGGTEGRVYSPAGTPLLGPLQLGGPAAFSGDNTGSVTIDDAGNVTYAWCHAPNGNGPTYQVGEIHINHLTADGVLLPKTMANTTTAGSQFLPVVTATGNGSFVVVWEGYGPGDDAGVFFQRYGPAE